MKKVISLLLVITMILASSVFAFAAEPDPNVTIVNPAENAQIASTSLLISVKIAKAETVKVSLLQEGQQKEPLTTVFESGEYTTTKSLSYYTKKIENVKQGNYIVRVDTLDSTGKVLYQTQRKVSVVKDSKSGEFNETENNTMNSFLQTLLKTVFGK